MLQSRPLLVGAVVLAGLSFSLGIMAGVPIGRVQEQDQQAKDLGNKIERRNKKSGSHAGKSGSTSIKSIASGASNSGNSTAGGSGSGSSNSSTGNSTSMMNTGGNRSTTTNGGTPSKNYVIMLGAYSPRGARKLLLRVNRLPGIARIRPAACKTLDESVPNRALGFRLRHPSNLKLNRVYLGCFNRESEAQKALRIIKDSRIIPINHAKLFLF